MPLILQLLSSAFARASKPFAIYIYIEFIIIILITMMISIIIISITTICIW